jgi:hypothetical protein
MDPIKRLYENRNNIRKKNLTENIEVWRFILNNVEEMKECMLSDKTPTANGNCDFCTYNNSVNKFYN